MKEFLNLMRDEPEEFVRKILKAEPDIWQAEALRSIAEGSRVAIRSGHGVGKTALEGWVILWFLFTRPHSKVIATAPTVRQLYDILWSELSKWLKRSELLLELFEWQKTKVVFKSEAERWFATARTAARPENLQGFHDEHLLFVLDEASGISDEIFEAINGALTGSDNRLLMCGNPTRNSGFFKRAFFEDRTMYRVQKVSSAESGRVSSGYCEQLVRQYGSDSDVVRVRVLGEFPKSESDGLVSLESVEAAMMRELQYKGSLVIGVDVARQGNDLTAFAARIGDCALPIETWRHSDLMATTGKIVHLTRDLMERYGKSRVSIRIDDDGIGAGVTDRLREVLHVAKITPCHNGGKARNKKYANFVTECYFTLRERLQEGAISLPRDDELSAELTTRKYSLTSSDKLILERKDEFKKRIGRSPDRADALALAFAPSVEVDFPAFEVTESYWRR